MNTVVILVSLVDIDMKPTLVCQMVLLLICTVNTGVRPGAISSPKHFTAYIDTPIDIINM